LLLNHKENGAWRVAGFELDGEWLSKKIVFGEFFVRLQGIKENSVEVGTYCIFPVCCQFVH
jgi:hypothetical protein